MNWAKILVDLLLAVVTVFTMACALPPLLGLGMAVRGLWKTRNYLI